MIASIIVNWFLGLCLRYFITKNDSLKQKIIVAVAVLINIGLLFTFKYVSFICSEVNLILNSDYEALNIALPIGISFFTFQALSYILDIYQRNCECEKNIINVALYISFFPQLIAGPIIRFKTINQYIHNRKVSLDDFVNGLLRFCIGLGKKTLIANCLCEIVDSTYVTNLNGGEISVVLS